jgi:subtilase family serine protease
VTGAGQTIAIYALAFPSNTDLTTFWTTAGITTQSISNIVQVPVAGGPASSPAEKLG